jgi:hypothetical protein
MPRFEITIKVDARSLAHVTEFNGDLAEAVKELRDKKRMPNGLSFNRGVVRSCERSSYETALLHAAYEQFNDRGNMFIPSDAELMFSDGKHYVQAWVRLDNKGLEE